MEKSKALILLLGLCTIWCSSAPRTGHGRDPSHVSNFPEWIERLHYRCTEFEAKPQVIMKNDITNSIDHTSRRTWPTIGGVRWMEPRVSQYLLCVGIVRSSSPGLRPWHASIASTGTLSLPKQRLGLEMNGYLVAINDTLPTVSKICIYLQTSKINFPR